LRGKVTTERFCFGKVRFGEEILGIEAIEREKGMKMRKKIGKMLVSVVAAE
jgi:hypothetical protein